MTILLSGPSILADQIQNIVLIVIFASLAIYFYLRLGKIDQTKDTAPQEEKRTKLFMYGFIVLMALKIVMLFLE
jgi:heme O synthase-like polyprenyltransferase